MKRSACFVVVLSVLFGLGGLTQTMYSAVTDKVADVVEGVAEKGKEVAEDVKEAVKEITDDKKEGEEAEEVAEGEDVEIVEGSEKVVEEGEADKGDDAATEGEEGKEGEETTEEDKAAEEEPAPTGGACKSLFDFLPGGEQASGESWKENGDEYKIQRKAILEKMKGCLSAAGKEEGAKLLLADKDGVPAFHVIAYLTDEDTATLSEACDILKATNKALLDTTLDEKNRTALHVARTKDAINVVIESDSSVLIPDNDGRFPLHYADSPETAAIFIDNMDADSLKEKNLSENAVEVTDRAGNTPLFFAHTTALSKFYAEDKKANILHVNDENQTALMFILDLSSFDFADLSGIPSPEKLEIKEVKKELANYLLGLGLADKEVVPKRGDKRYLWVKDNDGHIALYYAAQAGFPEIVEKIVTDMGSFDDVLKEDAAKSDIEKLGKWGDTPFDVVSDDTEWLENASGFKSLKEKYDPIKEKIDAEAAE